MNIKNVYFNIVLSQIFIFNYGKQLQSHNYATKLNLWLVSGNVMYTPFTQLLINSFSFECYTKFIF